MSREFLSEIPEDGFRIGPKPHFENAPDRNGETWKLMEKNTKKEL